MPVSHTMIAVAVSPERRGLAMGIAQNFGSNLFGSFIAPVVLVWFATRLNWHSAFYIAGLPGLISAVLLWFFIDEPKTAPAAERPDLLRHFSGILTSRNMIICVLISVLLVSYLVVCWAFMPLFLTQTRGFSPTTMSWLMGTLGISATIGSFVVAGLSDRIGRKPVMIITSFMGVILPLGAIYYLGSVWVLAAIFFVGWALTGIFPLFMATVPSESIEHSRLATAIALVVGIGEVFGGVLSPTLAGKVADMTNNMAAPLWIMMGLCVGAGLLALFLRETAPAVLKARASRV
jgi:MFS family permease